MVVLYIILSLAALWVILCFACFLIAERRMMSFDVTNINLTKGTRWEPLTRQILKGIEFIKTKELEEVYITSGDGLRLRGELMTNPEAKGTMLMFHGYRSSAYTDFACAADFYYGLGYSLLFVDERAHGKSGGKYIGFGVLEKDDCALWCQYIDERFPGMDMFLVGLSMGAATVLMASGLPLPDSVRGIVADCGFTSPHEILKWQVKRKTGLSGRILMPGVNFFSKHIAGYGLKDCSTLESLKKTELPVLFVHGNADNFVPTFMTKQNYQCCASEKDILLVDEAGHGVSYLTDMEACRKKLKAFVEKHRSV